MSREVRFSRHANGDHVRLIRFLAPRNPAAATKARQLIADAAATLADFPERGRRVSEQGLRELVTPFGRDAFLIRYRIETTHVIVVEIVHSREAR